MGETLAVSLLTELTLACLCLLSSSVLSALVPSVIAMKEVDVEQSPLFTSL